MSDVVRCRRCGHPLRSLVSRHRGISVACEAKELAGWDILPGQLALFDQSPAPATRDERSHARDDAEPEPAAPGG